MDVYSAAERAMAMRPEVWARHANPWSGWTRMAAGPAIIGAIYARVWLGGWCLVPLGLSLAWLWLNTRVFAPPRDHDRWPSRAVLGERWFLARDSNPMPTHHVRAAHWLTATSILGLVPLVWGLWTLDPGWTIAGAVLVIGPKLWFCDRMVWLYQDQSGSAPGMPHPDPILPPEETR